MSICSAYHDEENLLHGRGVCYGTKEREPCSCGGDESKCDYYEYKRVPPYAPSASDRFPSWAPNGTVIQTKDTGDLFQFHEDTKEWVKMFDFKPEAYTSQATTTTTWPPSEDYCASRLPCGVCLILDRMCPKIATYKAEPTWSHLPTSVCATGDAPEAKL